MFENLLPQSAHPILRTYSGIPQSMPIQAGGLCLIKYTHQGILQLMPFRAGGLCPTWYVYLVPIYSMQPAAPHQLGPNPPQTVTHTL